MRCFVSLTVEYALRNLATPIGVAEFVTALPPALAESLPTVEQMEAELADTPFDEGDEFSEWLPVAEAERHASMILVIGAWRSRAELK